MTINPIFRKMHLFKAAILLYQSSLECEKTLEFERDAIVLISYQVKKPFTIPKACTRSKTKRGTGYHFFRADNYAVAEEILLNKYCAKVKLRATIGGTQISYCQKITALPRRITPNFVDTMYQRCRRTF